MKRIERDNPILSTQAFLNEIKSFEGANAILESPETMIYKKENVDAFILENQAIWIITTTILTGDECDELAKSFYASFSDLEQFEIRAREQIGEYIASYFSRLNQKKYHVTDKVGDIVTLMIEDYE